MPFLRTTVARGDRGFTMVEVMVTIAMSGVLLGLVVSGWSRWSTAHAHSGAATQVQGALRAAQQRAVTDGQAVCVRFDAGADSYTVERGGCTTPSSPANRLLGPVPLDSRVDLRSPAFTHAGATLPGVTFSARGTATPGSVEIVRDDGDGRVRTVRVEGLTGRVAAN